MVRLALIVVVLVVFTAQSLGAVAAQPGTPIVDPFGPSPEECQIAPRSTEQMQALLTQEAVVATPSVLVATPAGSVAMRTVDLPAGTPADAETSAAVAATARQLHACRNAGDVGRYLALFSDAAILRTPLHRHLATLVVTQEAPAPAPGNLGEPRHFTGLFHARVLADGRVAAVAPPSIWGVPELYLFVRAGDRWLIDDIAPLGGPDAFGGVVGNTYTGERLVSDMDRGIGGYAFGITWGPEWAPVGAPDAGASSPDTVALSNGVSLVVLGSEPDTDLATCISPLPEDLAADLERLGLDSATELVRGIASAVDADGRPWRGEDAQRAFAVYDTVGRPGETATEPEPYRLYVECRAMAGGAWVLGITHFVPTADYATEVPARDQLLAAIEG